MAPTRFDEVASGRLNLARLREKRGISLDQIAESTKISKRFLIAIESEAFGELPGGIFSTSYIRQYAGAAGYDECALLDLYRSSMGLDTEPCSVPPAGGQPRKGGSLWQRSPVVL